MQLWESCYQMVVFNLNILEQKSEKLQSMFDQFD
jgi:hypothetical protein